MPLNGDVIAELDRFKNLKGDPFYALQIDAPWGSGKTHFIREYLKERYPVKVGEARPYLLVSLFGARTTEDLDRQISSQLFSASERETGAFLSSAIIAGAAWLKADKLATDLSAKLSAKALANALEEIRRGMIVFDDIERCSMPLKDALGYINNFLERDKFKVVLISNENAYRRPTASTAEKENGLALEAFKEKLVGRVLRFNAQADDAYNAFAENLLSEAARKIARDESERVLRLFRASKRDNLRSLRIGLESFDRLVSSFGTDRSLKSEGLTDILLGCIYVALEVGAAAKHEVVAQSSSAVLRRLLRGSAAGRDDLENADDKASQDIQERYGEVLNLTTPTIPFEYLIEFTASGVLRSDDIDRSLRTSPLMNDASDVPLWRRLIEIWDYNSNRLAADIQVAARRFKEFTITDPGELIHLAGIMMWLEDLGDLSISGGVSPGEFIAQYLSDLQGAGKHLDIDIDYSSRSRLSAYGYVVIGEEEKKAELIKVHKLITAALNSAMSTKYPDVYRVICENLKSPNPDFNEIAGKELAPYVNQPIFAGRDPVEMADIIMRDSSLDRHALQWLGERINTRMDSPGKKAEQPWLTELYSILKTRIELLGAPLAKWWMKIVDDHIGALVSR